MAKLLFYFQKVDTAIDIKGIKFPCVIQKYAKLTNFTGLYFSHFTGFRKTTNLQCAKRLLTGGSCNSTDNSCLCISTNMRASLDSLNGTNALQKTQKLSNRILITPVNPHEFTNANFNVHCMAKLLFHFQKVDTAIDIKGIKFPYAIQKYTKLTNFTGLYFSHFTGFRKTTNQQCAKRLLTGGSCNGTDNSCLCISTNMRASFDSLNGTNALQKTQKLSNKILILP